MIQVLHAQVQRLLAIHLFGLSRKAATEFSFFLAMPTMVRCRGVLQPTEVPHDLFEDDLPVFAIRLCHLVYLHHDCGTGAAQLYR
jgi:undecaprenyl pyrophosphate phosphatase UppP